MKDETSIRQAYDVLNCESPSRSALKKAVENGNETAKELLERIEQRQTPERMICHVEPVECCKRCGFRNVMYRFIFTRPNIMNVRAVCKDCGFNWSLPHVENLQRRTNSTLANWRKNVLARDGYRCRICGSEKELEAHHIIPVATDKSLMYCIDNGITLCKRHHDMVPKPNGGFKNEP